MSKNKVSKDEIEQKEQKEVIRKEQIQKDYNTYVSRIEKRKEAGEAIEVKTYDIWVRRTKDNKEVSGDSGETKNEKFRRLAKKRVTNVLHDLDLIQYLASYQYKYSNEEVEKILNALKLKLQDIENTFKAEKDNVIEFEFEE